MAADQRDLDILHGRLTALEALMVMVLSYSGADALRKAIGAIGKQPAKTLVDANELHALKTRLESALASVEGRAET